MVENSDLSLITEDDLLKKLIDIQKGLNYDNILTKIEFKDVVKKNKI